LLNNLVNIVLIAPLTMFFRMDSAFRRSEPYRLKANGLSLDIKMGCSLWSAASPRRFSLAFLKRKATTNDAAGKLFDSGAP
jgi:hypothetical protein